MQQVLFSREAKLAVATLLSDDPPGATDDLLLLYEVLGLYEEIGQSALARFGRHELELVHRSNLMHLTTLLVVFELSDDGSVLDVVSISLKY